MSGELVEFVGRQLLARYGVVFRALIERERAPVAWRELARWYRLAELRGDVRGGRFVQRFSGEQYALPEAVEVMRRLRRGGKLEGGAEGCAPHQSVRGTDAARVAAGDPLNLEGILTPAGRLSAQAHRRVLVG